MCLNPITIKTPGSGIQRFLRGSWQPPEVTIPCGKCVECLAKRQNDLASRLYQESKDKRHMYFVTLTYKPECEPFAATFWHVSRGTGEAKAVSEPFILKDNSPWLKNAREYSKLLCNKKRGASRIYESKILLPKGVSSLKSFDSDRNLKNDRLTDLYVRVAPSLNVSDVQKCLKRWRINYERNFGEKLPDFKYALVGEYGTSATGTHRPHYHLVFVSDLLERWQVDEFVSAWTFGIADVREVSRFNKNGTNGFSLVSRYVGKYISKGVFDTPSVRLGLVKNSRLCTSKGLGKTLTRQEIDYYTCQDMKQFNQNRADLVLTDDDKKFILPEIVKRLHYKIVIMSTATVKRELCFGMPLSLKKQIFNWHVDKNTGKACWSALYYMVADYIRAQFIDNDIKQFKRLAASRPTGKMDSQAYCIFEKMCEQDYKDREQIAFSRMQQFYSTHAKI